MLEVLASYVIPRQQQPQEEAQRFTMVIEIQLAKQVAKRVPLFDNHIT
jgi:uncharacterized membrane protein